MSNTRSSRRCPCLTNEESTGFAQARNGTLYSATIVNDDNKRNNSYFILFNPLHSMKTLYIREIVHTNTSDDPVLVKAYCNCCDMLPKTAERSYRITNNNTAFCDVPATAHLYRSTNISCINNTPLLEYAVKSYENFVNEVDGTIILAPGSYYIEVTTGFSCTCNGNQISSISWWEQPIRNCCCQAVSVDNSNLN
ncbi:DUF6143 family protein [uncultured Clostridium sp.]|uniref:DUF6143 family protein n=1 Tax=uncultured Clostridium sp. TaxID=59620 RepID=UPI0025E93EEF|nr:DUF6143 family protein [uncultured Clostridium sp.]